MIWRVLRYYILSLLCVATGGAMIGALFAGVAGRNVSAVPIGALFGSVGMAAMCAPMYLVSIVAWAIFSPTTFARKFGPGACAACGYELAGLKGTRCPECGHESASAAPSVLG